MQPMVICIAALACNGCAEAHASQRGTSHAVLGGRLTKCCTEDAWKYARNSALPVMQARQAARTSTHLSSDKRCFVSIPLESSIMDGSAILHDYCVLFALGAFASAFASVSPSKHFQLGSQPFDKNEQRWRESTMRIRACTRRLQERCPTLPRRAQRFPLRRPEQLAICHQANTS